MVVNNAVYKGEKEEVQLIREEHLFECVGLSGVICADGRATGRVAHGLCELRTRNGFCELKLVFEFYLCFRNACNRTFLMMAYAEIYHMYNTPMFVPNLPISVASRLLY